VSTLFYYAYELNDLVIAAITVIPLILLLKKHESISFPKLTVKKEGVYLWVVFFLLECALFYTLISHPAESFSNSPWNHIPAYFFLLYFCATALLFCGYKSKKVSWLHVLATSMHLFLTFSITLFVYPAGFGFDGFIHRATEKWIYLNGFIAPKSPVYIGQYSLIVLFSKISALSTHLLDLYFVPVLASISLPSIFKSTFSKTKLLKQNAALATVWIVPFVYFLSLHLTTPHNVLIFLTFIIVCTLWSYIHKQLPFTIPFMLSVAGLCIHALLGAPLFVCTLAIGIISNIKNRTTSISLLILYAIGIALLFPILFTLYFLLAGHPLPEITNPLSRMPFFFELFKRPFWFETQAPWYWELLYFWQRILPVVVVIAGLIGLQHYLKKHKKDHALFVFPLTFIGFWIGAFLLRSWITFPQVGALEQGDYPMRLLKSSIIFLLPFVFVMLKKIPALFKKKILPISITTLSILLTGSLYLSYPQDNAKAHFPGYNVTSHDIKAAHFIDSRHEQYNYIVLSNPLTAVAAMSEFGFPKYFETSEGLHSYYSIPSGGHLYKQYQKLLYEGQKREDMIDALDFVGVNTGYFVVSSFWSNFEAIVEGAKQSADHWFSINNGAMYIFEYIR